MIEPPLYESFLYLKLKYPTLMYLTLSEKAPMKYHWLTGEPIDKTKLGESSVVKSGETSFLNLLSEKHNIDLWKNQPVCTLVSCLSGTKQELHMVVEEKGAKDLFETMTEVVHQNYKIVAKIPCITTEVNFDLGNPLVTTNRQINFIYKDELLGSCKLKTLTSEGTYTMKLDKPISWLSCTTLDTNVWRGINKEVTTEDLRKSFDDLLMAIENKWEAKRYAADFVADLIYKLLD